MHVHQECWQFNAYRLPSMRWCWEILKLSSMLLLTVRAEGGVTDGRECGRDLDLHFRCNQLTFKRVDRKKHSGMPGQNSKLE